MGLNDTKGMAIDLNLVALVTFPEGNYLERRFPRKVASPESKFFDKTIVLEECSSDC